MKDGSEKILRNVDTDLNTKEYELSPMIDKYI